MNEQSSIDRFKRQVEIDAWSSLVKPRKILWVGGGAVNSVLTQSEFDVAVVVTSQDMLDEYKNLKGQSNIRVYQVSTLTSLPFPELSFDSVIGLNVKVDYSELESVFGEWQRITKLGGRIIFDAASNDHFCLSQYLTEKDTGIRSNNMSPETFNNLLSMDEIVRLADRFDFTIAKVTPFGALADCYSNNWLSMVFEQKRWWKRFLSLMRHDDLLFECGLFLENELVGVLPSFVAPKVMMAFDNVVSPQGNQRWLERQSKFIEQAGIRLDFDLLTKTYPSIDESWRTKLNELLIPLRNRVFFYTIIQEVKRLLPFLDLDSFIDRPVQIQYQEWQEQDEIDRNVMEFVENWGRENQNLSHFVYSGVPIAETLEYALVGQLIPLLSKNQ